MRVRIKFSKEGCMRFVGHLDMMRYFQKAIRRAGIDVVFSEGFSPHMIMSFAAPLGVGVTSTGEYFDLDIHTPVASKEAVERFNKVMVPGIEVLSVREIPQDKKAKGMTVVGAADYRVSFREGYVPDMDWQGKFVEFMERESIVICKKTKKSERQLDLKPLIFGYQIDGEQVCLKLSSGSVDNVKPDLVFEAFAEYAGFTLDPFALLIHREEVYTVLEEHEKKQFVSLEDLGEEIEL